MMFCRGLSTIHSDISPIHPIMLRHLLRCLLTALPRLLRRLLARSSPGWAPRTYGAMYSIAKIGSVFCCLAFLGMAACAGLPVSLSIPEEEKEEIITLFQDMVQRQKECQCCLDADVDITLKTIIRSGSINGFLQTMAPSFVKFVGINPLGQPLVIFTSDGEAFLYIDVAGSRAYEGKVQSKSYLKYAPAGFEPEYLYYWLIGRLKPGPLHILSVSKAEKGDGFWLSLCCGSDAGESLVLFDREKKVLLQHILLNSDGNKLADVRYEEYSEGACPLPRRIALTLPGNNGSLSIKLSWEAAARFTAADFEVKLPPGFEKVVVQ